MKPIYAIQKIKANDAEELCVKINRTITAKERVVAVLLAVPLNRGQFNFLYVVMFEQIDNCARLRETAKKVADDLFQDYSARNVRRLVVEYDDKKIGGGYCKEAVVDLVERILKS